MIPAGEVALQQRAGRAQAQTGNGGAISVDVPLLSDTAESFGEVFLLQDLHRHTSAFKIADRKALIDQAILSLDEFYVHKDLKWARHAVDAGCALRSLRRICDRLDDLTFHTRVGAALKSLRDIHTVYVLPEPYRSFVAFLPFTLAACRDGDDAPERFLVTKLLPGFEPGHFQPGCEILTWNGMPIGVAVREAGEKECAANDAALVALGVRLMTIRWLGTSAPPPEEWVTLGYLDADKTYREMRLSWRVLKLAQTSNLMLPIQAVWQLEQDHIRPVTENSREPVTHQALDQRSLVEEGTVAQMFVSAADLQSFPEQARRLAVLDTVLATHIAAPGTLSGDTPPSQHFSAEVYRTKVGDEVLHFGHLRIHGFNTDNVGAFVGEFRTLLHRLREIAPDYLLVDVRSNPGGDLNAAECIVQLLTPREVVPLPFQFRATRILERFVSNDGDTPQADNGEWVSRVSESVANGQQYSRSGPMTNARSANQIGQEYYGTVGLIFDAITYSSGDIFAAQFADLKIGPVIGVDPCTGGGGGNMVFHGNVAELAPKALGLQRLPHDARLHFAIRRCRRNGAAAAELIEEAGIPAEHYLPISSDDLMLGDRDLLHRAAQILHEKRRRRFHAEIEISDTQVRVTVTTDAENIAHTAADESKPLTLFISLDGRQQDSVETCEGKAVLTFSRTESDQRLRISVYELENWSFHWLKKEPLAVYTRTIPKLGAD